MKKQFFRTATTLSLIAGLFAFNGCTDFEDDINAINDRIDKLETGQIASVTDQVASLTDALDDANSLISTLQGTVNGLQTAINSIDAEGLADRISDLETLTEGLDDLKATVEGIDLSKYETIEAAEAAHATFATAKQLADEIGKIEGELAKYLTAEDLDGYLTENDLAGYLTQDDLNGYLKEDALTDYVKESDLSTKIQEAKDYADAAVKALSESLGKEFKDALAAKADASALAALTDRVEDLEAIDFDKKISDAIDAALKNDGEVPGDIAAAINSATEALKNQITALIGKVEDLANRIQSLVFVPEYNDNKATVTSYTMGGNALSENITVSATFKVTPTRLAPQVQAQAEETVFATVVPVKEAATRAAESGKSYSGSNVKVTARSGENELGLIDVEVIIPAKDYKAGEFAMALYIADPKVTEAVEEDPTATIGAIDGGTYISSEYVQTAASSKGELSNKYVLYNPTTGKEISEEERNVNMPWSEANGRVAFFDGYELYLNLGTSKEPEYISLADAAEQFNLDVADITPLYEPEYDGADVNYNEDIFTVGEAEGLGSYVEMASADPEEMKAYVGESVTINNYFYFEYENDRVDLFVENNNSTIATTYTISNQQLKAEFTPMSYDWDYATALKLADNATSPKIPNSQPIVFNEVELAVSASEDINILDFITGSPNVVVSLNGEEMLPAEAPTIKIEPLTGELHEVAKISVSGYEFAKGEENVYTFELTYTIDDSEVILTFELTLGEMMEDQTIDLGTETVNIFTGATKTGEIENANELAFAKVENYFADYDSFIKDFYKNAALAFATEKNGKTIDATNTHLNSNADGAEYTISGRDVETADDEFHFTRTVTTWYGVTYTFEYDVNMAAPSYALTTRSEWVTNGNVSLQGKYNASNVYTIDDANLHNYFGITGLPADATDQLTIEYTVLTEEGNDIPDAPEKSTVTVNGTEVEISNAKIVWGTYDKRSLEVEATLMMNGIELDSKTITLTTEDPITSFTAEDIKIKYEPGKAYRQKLWEKLTLTCGAEIVDNKPVNLINNKAAALNAIFTDSKAETKYGVVLTIDGTPTVLVGGVEDESYPTSNYSYANGVLTFNIDDAELQQPIEFQFKATLSYTLDEGTPKTATISVIFEPQE